VIEDFERCYRATQSRDARFDGWFVVAVTSTGVYCRPSCPASMPKPENTRFFSTAAAAQAAGFRSCRRCLPDAAPGSPEWNARSDVVARAMHLIADGVVDREGVGGLAERLHYSERHLHRQFVAEVGTSPKAVALARRAQLARLLIEGTSLPFSEVAFAAGFSSARQFNDTVRRVVGLTPTQVRSAGRPGGESSGELVIRLTFRRPFDADALFSFLHARAVPGVEEMNGGYRRTLSLPHGSAVVELRSELDHVRCALDLEDLRDLGAATQRCRRLLDLDADPELVRTELGRDALIGPLVEQRPGLRLPGHVDGFELAVRAVLGQQVSVQASRTLVRQLVNRFGDRLRHPNGSLTHLFPTPQALGVADLSSLPLTAARQRTLAMLARAVESGDIDLGVGSNVREVRARLLSIPGIGPWTASYVAMRGLGDPDAFLPEDLGVRRAMKQLAGPTSIREITRHAERWRPWRAYAVQHLWAVHS
jgi:AraC family transcriptional regulator of adaptative response / DNA-3-methyladenine glycosylase II